MLLQKRFIVLDAHVDSISQIDSKLLLIKQELIVRVLSMVHMLTYMFSEYEVCRYKKKISIAFYIDNVLQPLRSWSHQCNFHDRRHRQ